MKNHWPILIALAFISCAASLGLWQRTRSVNAAIAQKLNSHPVPPPEVKIPVSAAQPEMLMDGVKSVAPPKPTIASNPQSTASALSSAASVQQSRAQILQDLRIALQTKTGAVPTEQGGGGYSVTLVGSKVEVQPPPNWSVCIFNVNPRDMGNDTDDFKNCFSAVATSLGVNTTLSAGNVTFTTTSKMGNISIARDLANGNFVMIRPIQQRLSNTGSTPSIVNKPIKAIPAPPATLGNKMDGDF